MAVIVVFGIIAVVVIILCVDFVREKYHSLQERKVQAIIDRYKSENPEDFKMEGSELESFQKWNLMV